MGRSYTLQAKNGIATKRVPILTNTIDPKCIVYHRTPQVGDVITYNPGDCSRLIDGTTTTFSLDSSGVPTITGVVGDFGFEWGVYSCTVSLNGVEETAYVHHTEDGPLKANFTFGSQDANGWTDITPPTGARLVYVDPAAANNTSWGVGEAGTTNYVMGTSEPAGGWKTPTSVNAFKDIPAAYGQLRDGFADYLLLYDTGTHVPTSQLNFNRKGGASASARMIVTSYGTTGTARATISPPSSMTDDIINTFDCSYLGFTDLYIYPTWHDPDHGSFIGWNSYVSSGTCFTMYGGGGLPGAHSGFLIENCRLRSAGGGISLTGQTSLSDVIIRRNIIHDNYNALTRGGQGISSGGRNTGEYPDHQHYIGENVIDRNGWRTQAYSITGTADSGVVDTSLTDTGAFTGLDLTHVQLTDSAGAGVNKGRITSNTNDTVIFTTTLGTLDFSGGSATYAMGIAIGEDDGQGQATAFKHNLYVRYMRGTIIEGNIISRASSIAVKNTADSTSAAEELDPDNFPTEGFIEQYNFVVDNEIGIGGGGNDDFNSGPRFNKIRVCDNAIINQGTSNSTNRELGHGSQSNDWKNGLMSGNIALKTATTIATNNPFGFQISGHDQNYIFACNKAYNCTGDNYAVNSGAFQVSVSNPSFSDAYIYNNDFVEDGTGAIIGNFPSAQSANITWNGNRYNFARASATATFVNTAADSFADFLTATGETGSSTAAIKYADTGASIENIQTARGSTATLAGFIADQVAKSKDAWDTTLDADKLCAEIKKGFTDRPDVIFEATRVTLVNTAESTTQNIPFSNVGTPKGAIFIRTNTDGGWNAFYSLNGMAIGFTDGTNQWCTEFTIDPEIAPDQKVYSSQIDHGIARKCQGTANEGVDQEWEFTSFSNNQITITMTDLDPGNTQSWDCIVIAIGGADVDSIVVGNHNMGTGTASQEVSLGHRSDVLFTCGTLDSFIHDETGVAGAPVSRANSMITMGCAAKIDSSVSQMGWSRHSDDGVSPTITPSQSNVAFYNDAVMAKLRDGATENYSIAIDNMTSNGFNVSQSAAGDSAIFGYMSISFKNRPKMSMEDTTLPTSSPYNYTDTAMRPGFAFWMQAAGVSVYNTAEDTNNCVGLLVADGTNTYGYATTFADNETQTDDATAQSYGADGLVLTNPDGAATLYAASSAVTFSDSGLDVTLSTTPAATVPGRILVIGCN